MSSFVQIYERYINMVFEDEDRILIQTDRYRDVSKDQARNAFSYSPDCIKYRIDECFYFLRFCDELKNITETEAEIELILRDHPEILQRIVIIREILFVVKDYFREYVEAEFRNVLNCTDLPEDNVPYIQRIREIEDPKDRLKLVQKIRKEIWGFLDIFPFEDDFAKFSEIFKEKWFDNVSELYTCYNLDEYLRNFMEVFYGNISPDYDDDIAFYKREILIQDLRSYVKNLRSFFDPTNRLNARPNLYSSVIRPLENYFVEEKFDQFMIDQIFRLQSISYSSNHVDEIDDVISGIIEYIICLNCYGPILK